MRFNVFFYFSTIIVNLLLSKAYLLEKCCRKDIMMLNNQSFICSDKRNNNNIRISAVRDNSKNISKCIDVFSNKVSIFEYVNNFFVKTDNIDVSTKCCPMNFFYNNRRKSCEKSSNRTNIFNDNILKIGLPQCQIITDTIFHSKSEFSYNSSTLYIKDTKEIFTENQFCLDESVEGEFVIRVCRDWDVCDTKKCVKKCCTDGKSFVNGSHCEDTFVFGMKFELLEDFVGDLNDDFAIVHGYPGSIYIEPNISHFHLDEKGIFHNKKTNQIYPHPFQPYCIEHAQNNSFSRHVYFGFLTLTHPPLAEKFFWNRAAMIVSSGFLVFTIIFYVVAKEIRKIFGKTLVCFCVSLLGLYVLLVYHTFHMNLHLSKTKGLCKSLGFTIIYLGFSCFIWLQIMCFDINSTFGSTSRFLDKEQKKKMESRKFLFYNLYGWGVPLLFTMILFVFHLTEILPDTIAIKMGNKKCGMEKGNYSEIIFRAVPLTIIQVINSIFFVKTVTYVLKVKREIKRMTETPMNLKKKKTFFARRQRFLLVVKLSFTMGIFYLFEVISSFFDFNANKVTSILEIIWDFVNCLQGMFIFLIFVCKRKNYDKFKKSSAIERIRKISLTTSRKISLTTSTTLNTNNA